MVARDLAAFHDQVSVVPDDDSTPAEPLPIPTRPADALTTAIMIGNAGLTIEGGKTGAGRLEPRVTHNQTAATGASVTASIANLRTADGHDFTVGYTASVLGTDTIAAP
jgi:hypothetical protein